MFLTQRPLDISLGRVQPKVSPVCRTCSWTLSSLKYLVISLARWRWNSIVMLEEPVGADGDDDVDAASEAMGEDVVVGEGAAAGSGLFSSGF